MENQFDQGSSASEIAEPGESGFWGTPNDDSDGPKSWDDEVSFIELSRAQQAAKNATSSSSTDGSSNDSPTNDASNETNESNADQAARPEAFNNLAEELQQQQAAMFAFIEGMTQEGEESSESSQGGMPGGLSLVAIGVAALALVYGLATGGN